MKNKFLESLTPQERNRVYLTAAITIPAILVFAIVIVTTIVEKNQLSRKVTNPPAKTWNDQEPYSTNFSASPGLFGTNSN